MAYTKKQLETMLKTQALGWSGLYNSPFVNYRGKTRKCRSDQDEGGELDSEVIAQWLSRRFSDFAKGIYPIERVCDSSTFEGRPYAVKEHEKLRESGVPTATMKREEELIAQKLYIAGQSSNWDFGSIIDYQVPLKKEETDVAGKIDLLALSSDGKWLYILELKKAKSKETLLRCLLEAYTYYKTIKDKRSFIDSFARGGERNPQLAICPLFFKGEDSQPFKDWKRQDKWLCELIKKIRNEVHVDFMAIDTCGERNVVRWKIEKMTIGEEA